MCEILIKVSNDQILETVPTLTIGNLLSILPNFILDKEGIKHTLNINQVTEDLSSNKIYKVSYSFVTFDIFYSIKIDLIEALYETLLWCIKYKYL